MASNNISVLSHTDGALVDAILLNGPPYSLQLDV